MAFNLNNYATVAERLSQAQKYILSVTSDRPVMLNEEMGFVRVKIQFADGRSSVGTASFTLGLEGKSAQATFPIEDAETSAVGRALAFLGYESKKSIASREEMEEVQRRQARR